MYDASNRDWTKHINADNCNSKLITVGLGNIYSFLLWKIYLFLKPTLEYYERTTTIYHDFLTGKVW